MAIRDREPGNPYAPAAMGTGAGDDAGMLGTLVISTSPPELLFSLLVTTGRWSALSLFSLLLSAVDTAAEAGASSGVTSTTSLGLGGATQRWISHSTPVKVLSRKFPLFHLRHGLPVRSRARRPALMAPWLALGPRRCALPRAGSRLPSSLEDC